jgi:calcineurin-like phosphoesterase family protein
MRKIKKPVVKHSKGTSTASGGKSRKVTTLDSAQLLASVKHHPGPGNGRKFAASRLPASFQTIIDPNKNPPQPFRPLPPPTGAAPFRLSLDSVLSAKAIQTIETSGRMVVHAVGDTGGVNTPTYIENVATYMEDDFSASDASMHPSFFYHLGDVVYYDGEIANYYPEFYEPYMTYPAPIFAIPGNHDGDIDPQTKETTLQAFIRNFCQPAPVHQPEAQDAPRDAMTQPNVYWTLLTPLATFIGLYSNCPEGGVLKPDQIAWFESELRAAPVGKALILAVHHPLYSAYGAHPGSTTLYTVIDSACRAANRVPDLVLSGHVHDYQRFTGTLADQNVPCIVAGAGGYNLKLHTLSKIFHNTKLPIAMTGSGGMLENFNDAQHGYLRLQITNKTILCEYFAVPEPGVTAKLPLKHFDAVTINIR